MKRQSEAAQQNRVASMIGGGKQQVAGSISEEERDHDLKYAHECKYANFWVAYDALDLKQNKHLIDQGIEMAKELQKAVVQIGTHIIDKKDVKMGSGFRYVLLENDTLKDVSLF